LILAQTRNGGLPGSSGEDQRSQMGEFQKHGVLVSDLIPNSEYWYLI